MAHGTFALDGSKVGSVVDALAGNLTQILITGSPTSWELPEFDPGTGLPTKGYFCLVDSGAVPLRVLFSFNGHANGHSPHATNKVSSYPISFGVLKLQSCPKGATYSVTTA